MGIIKHIPNTITSMNLLSGIMGVIFTLQGRPDIAFPLMLAAAVFDFCDGLAARMLHAYSDIGKELDSLSDMVSFGVLPSLMLYKAMDGVSPAWVAYLPLFLAVMSALRLAKFNIDERQSLNFIGLPTPSAAMICGSLAYFIAKTPDGILARWAETPVFHPLLAIVLGLLLVSEIPMFGMKIKKDNTLLDMKRTAFFTIAVICLVVTAVLRFNWSFAILLVFSVYVLENCIFALFKVDQ